MPRIRTLVLLIGDSALIAIVFFATAWYLATWGNVWDIDFSLFLAEDRTIPGTLIVLLTIIFGFYFMGHYETLRVNNRISLLEDLMMLFGITFLLQAVLSYSRTNLEISRRLMLIATPISIVGLIFWRSFYGSMQLRVFGRQRILFLGNTPLALSLAKYIDQNPERGYELVGRIPFEQNDIPAPQMETHFRSLAPDRIVVAGSVSLENPLVQTLLSFSMSGLTIEPIGDFHEDLFNRVSLETISIKQLIFSPSFRPKPGFSLLQEIYGRVLAFVGLILAAPLMLLTLIAVRLDSPGSALLRQIRIGKGGHTFTLLKFRSMFVNADSIAGAVRAQENDPRVTRVGRWIRLTRIDELPQLINVLRGEMALVGPRPEMPELEKGLLTDIPLYPQRQRVKPGITGWAQIHHEPEDAISNTVRKLEYDLFYIKKMSPALDFLIMFHTLKAVVLRLGAR